MSATILTGDSLELLPTLRLFDLVVTDPPYATTTRRRRGVAQGGASWRGRRGPVEWPEQEYAMTDHVLEERCDRCRRSMYAASIEGHDRGPYCRGCDELAPRDCWCPPVPEPA